MLEEFIQRAFVMSQGDPTIFLRSPISGTFLLLAIAVLALAAAFSARRGIVHRRLVSVRS
jgi:putative tricarboxylic transport membrane protein